GYTTRVSKPGFFSWITVGPLRQALRGLEARMHEPDAAMRYADLLSQYEAQGGFQAEAHTERVLEGLGLDESTRRLPTPHLSSGQRARAELARVLLTPADLLIMDEPTNHLDLAAQAWLEGYLARLDTAYLLVSHDRLFLSRATTRIFELRRGQVTVFEGNYDFYRVQRAVSEKQAWERYQAQQRRIAAAEQAAERRLRLARQVATKPGGGEDRDHLGRKAAKLARTSRILRERGSRGAEVNKPWQETPMPVLDFSHVARTGDQVLRLSGLTKSYGTKCLFQGLEVSVGRGERWAILGPNGTGKTTLLRMVLGLETPEAGSIEIGAHVKFGYYAQEGEQLDAALSPLALCLAGHTDETWVRTILACLKLRPDQAHQTIGTMSAGERGKVALARLLLSGANVLLLDEPTNHLDLDAREAVEGTLTQFPGTIIFVSHDRYFIETLADKTLDLAAWAPS
uniref:ABC-F family ATP-binding cassette domain-containing protein n=1 Tax=Candidatus Entotheonella palauensis TaxID=93172 RepID=UPI00117767AD